MKVYKAISDVISAMSSEGISKNRKNLQQGYSFRGIDDVYNALAPMLAKAGLVILPRITARQCVERQTAKGGALFYVTVEAEFDFVSAEDGSKHTVKTFGEAMDSADKATNKAMSAAFKYAAFQTFCIPTEGDNDTENTTPEPAPKQETRHSGNEYNKQAPRQDKPSGDKPASDKQKNLVKMLVEQTGVNVTQDQINALTFKSASAWIEKLNKMKAEQGSSKGPEIKADDIPW